MIKQKVEKTIRVLLLVCFMCFMLAPKLAFAVDQSARNAAMSYCITSGGVPDLVSFSADTIKCSYTTIIDGASYIDCINKGYTWENLKCKHTEAVDLDVLGYSNCLDKGGQYSWTSGTCNDGTGSNDGGGDDGGGSGGGNGGGSGGGNGGGSSRATTTWITGADASTVESECQERGGHITSRGITQQPDGSWIGECELEPFDVEDDGSGWSRGEHPGRDPTGNGNHDPGDGSAPTLNENAEVEGRGYSSTGGLKSEDPTEPSTSVFDCGSGKNGEGIFCLLNNGIVVLTFGVGIAATVGIAFSGIQYATAAGSVEMMTKARKRIINILIGLAAYAVMWGLVNWLIPGGIF